jgi:hypothetical protein
MKGWKMTNLVTIFVLTCVAFLACYTASAQTNWNKYSGNPILVGGPPGAWDQYGVLSIGVLLDSATYHSSKGGWSQGKFLEAVHNRRVGSHVVFMVHRQTVS